MTLQFVGNEYFAEITMFEGGYMLTIRSKSCNWFKRRRYDSVGAAQDELWRYDTRWKVI